MTKLTSKKTSRMTQQEKKEAEAAFLLELQKAQAEDLSDAVDVATRLFGEDVDPLVVVAVSDRMFDDNGEIDEQLLTTKMAQAKAISVATFGELKGARPDVIIAVYDKVIDLDPNAEEDDE